MLPRLGISIKHAVSPARPALQKCFPSTTTHTPEKKKQENRERERKIEKDFIVIVLQTYSGGERERVWPGTTSPAGGEVVFFGGRIGSKEKEKKVVAGRRRDKDFWGSH